MPVTSDYQAARAAIGAVRRNLPPNHDFRTRPVEFKDDALVLPADLSLEALTAWACNHADSFSRRICPLLETKAISKEVERRREILSVAVIQSPEQVLIRFAGKDLLAGIAKTSWFSARRISNAGELRARLRDWVQVHPEETLDLLPEWKNFVSMLNAE